MLDILTARVYHIDMKTYYVVYKERAGDEAHEYELVEMSRHESLAEAEKALEWKENLYGRIDKVRATYTPPPAGRVYKKERLGWSDEFIETVKEN